MQRNGERKGNIWGWRRLLQIILRNNNEYSTISGQPSTSFNMTTGYLNGIFRARSRCGSILK